MMPIIRHEKFLQQPSLYPVKLELKFFSIPIKIEQFRVISVKTNVIFISLFTHFGCDKTKNGN